MRTEIVEILSDRTNAAIMRHPGRAFPGVLVQGDTLYTLCRQAELACEEIGPESPGFEEFDDLRERLWSLLDHYKATLREHGMKLPFHETGSS